MMNLKGDNKQKILIPIISVLCGFLLGAIVMIITGINPITGYSYLLKGIFKNPRRMGEWIVVTTPLILTGISVGFGFRTGLFNIGAEGQLLVGSLAAVSVGVLFDLPVYIHLPLAVIAAGLAGAFWGFIPGYLKAKFNVHEVVVTIMLNYSALHIVNYLIKRLPGSTNTRSVAVKATATLKSEFLSGMTMHSRLNWGFLIAIAAAIIFWYVIEKTSFGYELRSVGFNPDASQYAGMKVNRNIIYSMMIAGAFAGLAGAVISIGTFDYARVVSAFEGYGYDGIAVSLLGNNGGFGILLAGLLFGGLKAGASSMASSGVPKEIGNIIMAFIVLFAAMNYGFKILVAKITTRKSAKKGVK